MRFAKFSKPICIALKPMTYNRIKQLSNKRRESMAETMRDIIIRYFALEDEENNKSQDSGVSIADAASMQSLNELVQEDKSEAQEGKINIELQ